MGAIGIGHEFWDRLHEREGKLRDGVRRQRQAVCETDGVALDATGHCPVCHMKFGADQRRPPLVSEEKWARMSAEERDRVRAFAARTESERREREAEAARVEREKAAARQEEPLTHTERVRRDPARYMRF